MNRRSLLRALGTAGVAGLAGCNTDGPDTPTTSPTPPPDPSDTPTRTDSPTPTGAPDRWEIDPLEHDKLVGAHYYPWYESKPAWEDWLWKTPGTPVLGEYDSADEAVINQHVTWAREHGINWFNVSWWGPDSGEDTNIREHFLDATLAQEIQFSILYESVGRLGDDDRQMHLDRPAVQETLREDFRYLEETFFDEPTYLTIDGRPVLYVYAASFFHPRGSDAIGEAFRAATDAIDADPYLLADVIDSDPYFIGTTHTGWMAAFDAVTDYNPATSSADGYGELLEHVERDTVRGFLQAHDADHAYVPAVVPGFDNRNVRDPGWAIERSEDGFRELCRQVRHATDPALDAVLVTTFNEWPEYTAVEPGESYGTTYLDVVADELATDWGDRIDPGAFHTLTLDFNRTITPEGSDRALSLVGTDLSLLAADGTTLAAYDIGVPEREPYLVEGAWAPAEAPDWGTARWFGGPTGRATVYVEPPTETPATVEWVGLPMRSGQIEADVYFDGQLTDHVAFGERSMQTYTLSLRR